MKIYIVELHDYDRSAYVGYFTDPQKAKQCCEYLNRTDPSQYNDEYEWIVVEYTPNDIDYESKIKELDKAERIKYENRLERIKQEELTELARLKAKYER
jgi:hypothetical protein